MSSKRPTGSARRAWLIASSSLAVAATLGSMALVTHSSAEMVAGSSASGDAFNGRDAAVLLHRLGLTPEALTAAGLNTTETRSTLAAALAYQFGPDITSLTKQLNQARQQAVKPPRADQQGQTRVSVTHAELALKQRLDHAFDFVTAGLLSDQKRTLGVIRANQSWGLPTKYLVVERTEKDWLKLRGALGTRRSLEKGGRSLPANVSQFLATVESDQAVTVAATRLEASLAATKEAWNTQLQLRSDQP